MEVQKRAIKKKPTKIEEMTKEQIRLAILKKRECNAKAQNIVESLLESSITEEHFIKCLPDINQGHLDDVIEERSIAHLCGYPLCPKVLSKKDIPKQKYRISVKTNKVYDITARKSFCSNSCYKAAMHVKKQMLTSPLWFREYEDVAKFHLLPLDSAGSLGQEIDVSLVERIEEKPKTELFTSFNEFASASLNEINEQQQNKVEKESASDRSIVSKEDVAKDDKENENVDKKDEIHSTKCSEHDKFLLEIDSEAASQISLNIPSKTDNQKEKSTIKDVKKKPANRNPLNIVGDIIEKPERRIDPILTDMRANVTDKEITITAKKVIQKKQPLVTVITIEVEKCLAEWFTLDTLLFLFGEEKVKEMVADKGECIQEYLNNYAKSIFYSSNTYDQYQVLCRKLNMLELEDRRNDAQTLQRETKPLPDYSILQEESKKMQLKVRAFLAGDTNISEIHTSDNTKTTEDDTNLTRLPLVDKNAQNALRRRIVCQHLNKVLPDLLRSLGLLTHSISSDVSLIVNTFKLKANNVMFKPIQWTLIAIVIVKLLSLRDKRLEYLLEQPTAYQHMQLLLLSYKQDGGYLDRLISWLTDVDRLLDTNDTQLTIE